MKKLLPYISLEIILLTLILTGALGIRMVYFQQAKKSGLLGFNLRQGTDMAGFHEWGTAIAEGDWISRHKKVLFQPPTYSYFLGIIYSFLGTNYLKVCFVQALIGILLTFLLYKTVQKISPDKLTPFIAASIAAFYPVSLYYEGLLQRTSLVTFLYLLLCYLVLLCNEYPDRIKSFLIGLLLGIINLAEPQTLLFIPVIFVYLFWFHKKNYAFSFFFCLGVTFILVPVALRNYLFGEFVLISSNGPITWAAGNSVNSTGWFFDPTEPLMPVFSSGFVLLQIKKIILWFSAYEIPNNTNYYQFKEHIPILNIPFLSFGTLIPFAFLGLLVSIKETAKKLSFLYLFLILYTAITVIFMSLSRFRFPSVPILIIFASFGITWLINQIKKKNYLPLIVSLGAIVLLTIFFKTPAKGFPLIQPNYYDNLGDLFYAKKRYPDALIEYHKAVRVSHDPDTFLQLGNTYLRLGMKKKAIYPLEQYLEAYPDAHPIKSNLGVLHLSQKNYEKALFYFNKYLKTLSPQSSEYAKIQREIGKINTLQRNSEQSL